jgi:hypothetical protein
MTNINLESLDTYPGLHPSLFLLVAQDVRAGRYKRHHIKDEDVLVRLQDLDIPPESITVVGATMLPPESVEAILFHRRKVRTGLVDCFIDLPLELQLT